MTDFERLVDRDDLGAALLRSARTLDAERARERRVALMGAAAGLSAITAAQAAKAGTNELARKTLLQALLKSSLAKGIAIVIAASAVAIGVVKAASDTSPPTRATLFSPSLPERMRIPDKPIEPLEDTPPSLEVPRAVEAPLLPAPVETSSSRAAPARVAPQKGAAPSPSTDGASLAEELAVLRLAREALASGDGARALRSLDDYATRFPQGRLSLEAEVLRIEALSRTGDASAALRARRFLDAHPGSPYAERLRPLAGDRSIP